MVTINTFNSRPVWHVRHMPDSSVLLKLYERRLDGRARYLRVSLAQWLAGRGIYLLESHASPRALGPHAGPPPAIAPDDILTRWPQQSVRGTP